MKHRNVHEEAKNSEQLTKKLNAEQQRLADYLAPMQSCGRGVTIGAMLVSAINTAVPGQFGVADWPAAVRIPVALLWAAFAVHALMRQRGLMAARRLSQS